MVYPDVPATEVYLSVPAICWCILTCQQHAGVSQLASNKSVTQRTSNMLVSQRDNNMLVYLNVTTTCWCISTWQQHAGVSQLASNKSVTQRTSNMLVSQRDNSMLVRDGCLRRVCVFVSLLLNTTPTIKVYLRDGYDCTIVRPSTLKY